MAKINFQSFSGYVTAISDFTITPNGEDAGCYKIITIEKEPGNIVHFIVSPATYFVDHVMVTIGDWITGYYDGNAPVPLIYPPQYQALVIVKENTYQNVLVDYFDWNLVSSNGQLKLNLSPFTQKLLVNGQASCLCFLGTVLQGIQYVRRTGEGVPVNWMPGQGGIIRDPKYIGRI